jgi:exodeoxyribonuclease V alpha subunit
MQIKNNYQLEWKKLDDFSEGQGVFNGDIGFIEKIDNEYGEVTVVFDDSKYVTYDFTQLDEIEPAYAVTVHKSQGSEFPIVVMPVTWFPPMLATRNLLYTAVTRGKTAVVLVGSETKMNGMVDNNAIIERYSGLDVRLRAFL